jgi:hypothetical protein
MLTKKHVCKLHYFRFLKTLDLRIYPNILPKKKRSEVDNIFPKQGLHFELFRILLSDMGVF